MKQVQGSIIMRAFGEFYNTVCNEFLKTISYENETATDTATIISHLVLFFKALTSACFLNV